jgi:hypothetical protein
MHMIDLDISVFVHTEEGLQEIFAQLASHFFIFI